MDSRHHHLERFWTLGRLLAGRLRCSLLRIRGAKIGIKTVVGARCGVDRPWGLLLGERTSIEQDVYLKLVDSEARLVLGNHVFVGKGCEFDVMSSVIVGAYTLFAPGCFVTDHNHGIAPDRRIDQQECVAQAVRIGEDVWLGTGVVVLPGVTIGDGAVIGAHAVVNRDIPAGAIAVGVPGKVVGWRHAQKKMG